MARERNQGKYGKPSYNQVAKIVAKFGGEKSLAAALGISRITVYRWQYKSPYGSDGLIPTAKLFSIRAAARQEGILLTAEDFMPEYIKYA